VVNYSFYYITFNTFINIILDNLFLNREDFLLLGLRWQSGPQIPNVLHQDAGNSILADGLAGRFFFDQSIQIAL